MGRREKPHSSEHSRLTAGVLKGEEDLPHHNDPLWVERRKTRVVTAVRSGVISLHEALERFNISAEQFVEWEYEVGRDMVRKRQIFRDMNAGRGPHMPRRPRKRTQ